MLEILFTDSFGFLHTVQSPELEGVVLEMPILWSVHKSQVVRESPGISLFGLGDKPFSF